MNKRIELLTVLSTAFLFTLLFYRQGVGLNLFIVELSAIAVLFKNGSIKLNILNHLVFTSGLILSALCTVLINSEWAIFVNIITLVAFTGFLIYPVARSSVTSLVLALANFFVSQYEFLNAVYSAKFGNRQFSQSIWKSRVFIIPLIIIFLFVGVYRCSNPVFDQMAGDAGSFVSRAIDLLFHNFDFAVLLTFGIGIILSNPLFFRMDVPTGFKEPVNDQLERIKKTRKDLRITALRNEYKAGVFLLAILNITLLVVNIIDINWVWFNFTWNGQYLKQFVHEGTWLLLLSIISSVVIVLYFFRGNLSFYSKNKTLKYLSYAWLVQNGVLTLSVAIRNFRYINYFALAYKRIALIVFLMIVIYSLYTVYIKVSQRKSAFYLLRMNAFAIYIILVSTAFINWDNLIANYNFKHTDTAFVELDYLATLSDNSLPLLDRSPQELMQIYAIQQSLFHFDQQYMTPEVYHSFIQKRKQFFIDNWENKSILSWNLSEQLAYNKLTSKVAP